MTGPLQVVQRRLVSRSIFFATCNKNESCPCLASNDKPTGTPSASAIGSDTCGRRPMPAMLVRRQCARIIAASTRTASGWIALARRKRRCCWDAQQIVRSEKLVQTSKILFASLQCLRDASPVELRSSVENWQLFRAQIPAWR